jgi:large subunit ribosomal protein L17
VVTLVSSKTGNRLGDNAEMCFIEFVDYDENMMKTAPKKSTRTRRRSKKAAAPAAEAPAEAPAEEVKEAVLTSIGRTQEGRIKRF